MQLLACLVPRDGHTLVDRLVHTAGCSASSSSLLVLISVTPAAGEVFHGVLFEVVVHCGRGRCGWLVGGWVGGWIGGWVGEWVSE